jgi:hypothetical protein
VTEVKTSPHGKTEPLRNTEDIEFEREINKMRQMQAVSKRMYKDMRKCNECEAALIRAGQRLVTEVKTSPHGKTEPLRNTEDIEFEREINKMRQMQAVSKRMYKDMRKCNECEAALIRAGQRLVTEVKTSPHGKTEPLRNTMEVFGGAMEELSAHAKILKTNQDTTFSEPMKRYSNVYKHVEFHARQRELKLQEFEKQQSRLDKLEKKQSTAYSSQSSSLAGMQAKLELTQRNLSLSRADYDRIHQRMMQELPKVMEGRVGYFEHCLQAIIEAQVLYYHDCAKSLCSCLEQLTGTSEVPEDHELKTTSDKLLTEIRALSIVGGSHT